MFQVKLFFISALFSYPIPDLVAFYPYDKRADPLRSVRRSGLAAAECGKAPPFRQFLFVLLRLRLINRRCSLRLIWRLNGKAELAEPYRTVRRPSRRDIADLMDPQLS
jgi:hypothetical protein